MNYIDEQRLQAVDAAAFARTRPYPWLNAAGLLSESGYRQLLDNLPDVSMFTPMFDVRRAHGQQPHDRYALEYDEALDVAPCWHEFVQELQGETYGRFLKRMFGRGGLKLNFHWHYTPRGCSVSPHCDAKRKLGSHIFYLNTADDWDPAWGGETLILDDGGRFQRSSSPAFEAFDSATAGVNLGNYSLLFKRQGNSWHGVREIDCPEGLYRKVFIVVINDRYRAMLHRVRNTFSGKAQGGY